MRNKTILLSGLSVLALTLAACGSTMEQEPMPSSETSMGMESEMMESPESGMGMESEKMQDMDARGGVFKGMNDKSVEGMARVNDGMLELTDFTSDEGPDLHVYLANGTDEMAVEGGMRLGKLDADNQMQELDLEGIDTAKYSHVVIHCDKAKAVFGAAPLS